MLQGFITSISSGNVFLLNKNSKRLRGLNYNFVARYYFQILNTKKKLYNERKNENQLIEWDYRALSHQIHKWILSLFLLFLFHFLL